MDEFEQNAADPYDFHLPENEDSPSQYNDGDGIEVSVVFTPLPPQPKKGEKRCKNAKTLPINLVIHFNENDTLATLLDSAIDSVEQTDNLCYAIGNRTGRLSPENFSIKYTVPRSAYKDVDIKSLEDFNTLITQACKMKNPLFKLFITQTEHNDDVVDEDEDESAPARKVPKVNPTEMKINDYITELSCCYTCEDRSCKFPICWPAPPNAKHVHLTPLHLRTWAAAINATENDPNTTVDLKNPPNTKLFNSSCEIHNIGDTALLARRRDAATVNNTSPSVVVNNDFKELANVLLADNRNIRQPPAQVPAPPPATVVSPQAALIPKITLQTFCDRFKLSISILTKLNAMKITGPHCLRFVTDGQLVEKGQLDIGELADVRDAQEHWMQGVEN
ncbi:hypothetical protein JVT61DRAFT_9895 [Boletus reticuloceps]|uniref:Uncharacterized protein n=1 Tax=Boletus reticuloceps TaxID=495285 RepID=A0A8I2YFX1_9AGAM|nr:hypothetical protein JVT61DRAFT_9895 [Boletus reticuloceps]